MQGSTPSAEYCSLTLQLQTETQSIHTPRERGICGTERGTTVETPRVSGQRILLSCGLKDRRSRFEKVFSPKGVWKRSLGEEKEDCCFSNRTEIPFVHVDDLGQNCAPESLLGAPSRTGCPHASPPIALASLSHQLPACLSPTEARGWPDGVCTLSVREVRAEASTGMGEGAEAGSPLPLRGPACGGRGAPATLTSCSSRCGGHGGRECRACPPARPGSRTCT